MIHFEADRHVEMPSLKWDEAAARNAIEEISLQTERSFSAERLWPAHPEEIQPDQQEPYFGIYNGAAGIIWAQKQLEELGYVELFNDYSEVLTRCRAAQLKGLEAYGSEYMPGLLFGDLGFLVAQMKIDRDSVRLTDIEAALERNLVNAICEYMWGSPGSIAFAISQSKEDTTKSPQLNRLVVKAIDVLERQLVKSQSRNCYVWRQNLYGFDVCHLGAVHGFAGNAFSVLKSLEIIGDEAGSVWIDRIQNTVISCADADETYANWPQSIDGERPGRNSPLLQLCHGAPGIVCCLASLMNTGNDDFDSLMLKAGNLIWHAGPLTKGSNLCHGTAGNGFAFLKLFEATGNEMWLTRARQFAMFSILQTNQKREEVGDYHYSLWAGDTGMLLFLASCMDGNASIPTMDYF